MQLPIVNVAMMTRLLVLCGFPGVQCGLALDKADLGKVFQVFVQLFQRMNHLGLGDQRLVGCED